MPDSANLAASGVTGLDSVLGGGFPKGQISLLRGASGVGKTTLGLQFLLEGARQGESALYLGTSETEQDIRQVAKSHGWSLEGVSVHHHEHRTVTDEQTMLHPAEVELPRTMESMLSIVRKVSPSRLVIDSLAEFRVLARDELWYRRQLMTLKQYFAGDACTVLLIELFGGTQPVLDSIVSGVVELERTTPEYGPDRRRLRVSKIRGQEFSTGRHDYVIRRGGLEIFPRLTAAEHRQPASFEQISTGLPRMDEMLCGGFTRGTSVLLLGPSGTGKSLMSTQLAVAAAGRGEKSALFDARGPQRLGKGRRQAENPRGRLRSPPREAGGADGPDRPAPRAGEEGRTLPPPFRDARSGHRPRIEVVKRYGLLGSRCAAEATGTRPPSGGLVVPGITPRAGRSAG